jgi:hypothetical protein
VTKNYLETEDLSCDVDRLMMVCLFQCDKVQHATSQTQTIVTMSKLISQTVMQEIINFVYTGQLDTATFKQQVSR